MKDTVLFIDTEFNGLGGKLISMALVGEERRYLNVIPHEFYEVIEIEEGTIIDPWVKENVIPILTKAPIKYQEFQEKLRVFLQHFPDGFTIVADWPDDIKYFCESLITGPGEMLDIPSFEMKLELIDSLSTANLSKVPHNALEDAKALRKELINRHNYSLY